MNLVTSWLIDWLIDLIWGFLTRCCNMNPFDPVDSCSSLLDDVIGARRVSSLHRLLTFRLLIQTKGKRPFVIFVGISKNCKNIQYLPLNYPCKRLCSRMCHSSCRSSHPGGCATQQASPSAPPPLPLEKPLRWSSLDQLPAKITNLKSWNLQNYACQI